MAFKDSKTKDILKIKLVSENYFSYKNWVDRIQFKRIWKIKAYCMTEKMIRYDDFEIFQTQMCNYHQVAIITRYITKRPRLEANKELRNIAVYY